MDREYNTEKSGMNGGLPVRYAVGQGMGLFSSWGAMAIMHHFIANHICKIPLCDYKLVGDDLLIRGTKEQFSAYLAIMAEIGLEVNLHKTIPSENTCEHNVEFARNYIISGLHIIPVPFGQLFSFALNSCAIESPIGILIKDWEVSTIVQFLATIADLSWKTKLQLCYYLFSRLRLPFAVLPYVNELVAEPWLRWISEASFLKMEGVIDNNNTGIIANLPIGANSISFINALRSQCTMRTVKDMLKSRAFSESILLLGYSNDTLTQAACIWHERLINANIIVYDTDNCLGNPLLSKRERRLLEDITTDFKNKIKKSKKVGINNTALVLYNPTSNSNS